MRWDRATSGYQGDQEGGGGNGNDIKNTAVTIWQKKKYLQEKRRELHFKDIATENIEKLSEEQKFLCSWKVVGGRGSRHVSTYYMLPLRI